MTNPHTPKGYWLVDVEVTNPDQYAAYSAVVRPFLAERGARFVVRGGAMEVVEGVGRTRQVVVEFESYAAARAAYWSDEYQPLIKMRQLGAHCDFMIVEGLGD